MIYTMNPTRPRGRAELAMKWPFYKSDQLPDIRFTSDPPVRRMSHADFCALVFDTDGKTLYVEREVAHADVHDGLTEIQTTTMDACDYLKQGGQTAGHRELWRLLRTLFEKDINSNEVVSNRLS